MCEVPQILISFPLIANKNVCIHIKSNYFLFLVECILMTCFLNSTSITINYEILTRQCTIGKAKKHYFKKNVLMKLILEPKIVFLARTWILLGNPLVGS